MRFSVIVPVYNVEAYLIECLDSIDAQTCRDFECILVDDGSTDSSGCMCDSYAVNHSNFEVIHKPNGGLSSSRNEGIRAAKGEYLLFVDSDDFWISKNFLQDLENEVTDTEADVVRYGMVKLDNETHEFSPESAVDPGSLEGLSPGATLEKMVAQGTLHVSASSMAVRRQFIAEHNLYFVEGIKSEDIEWAFRLYAGLPSWGFLCGEHYAWRQNRPGSITQSIDACHLRNYVAIIKSSLDVANSCPQTSRRALLSYLMYHAAIAVALSRKFDVGRECRDLVDDEVRPILNKYILANTLHPKVKPVAMVYRIGGYNTMAWVLGLYISKRGY